MKIKFLARGIVTVGVLCALTLGAAAHAAGKPVVDKDKDGYNSTVDCNDNNAAINPGATEICTDSVDNNCNGTVNENCGTPTCTDNDGDGYATQGGTCGPVDCNDNNAAIKPGATEICTDSLDNNCNGTVNENCSASRDVIVVANNDLGMHCACPGSEYFMLLPPFNTIRAQVIERGGRSPVVLDNPNDIRVEYDTVENTEASLNADPYYSKWIQMMPKYGFGPAKNAQGLIQGLTGSTLDGQMHAMTGEGWWEAVGIPVFPDDSNNSPSADKVMIDNLGGPNRNPYLSVKVNVFDQTNNQQLATTTTVAPVAFGGCCSCHLTVTKNNTGIQNPTALDSFNEMGRLHGLNGSNINIANIDPDTDGQKGPVRCSSCHLDPAMGEAVAPGIKYTAGANNGQRIIDPATGNPYAISQFTFSDVLHRGHLENPKAMQMDPNLANNCYACHPGNGVNCYRGAHVNAPGSGANGKMWCSDCHGDLNQRVAEGQLLKPWSDQTLPACSSCHTRTGELSSSDSTYLHLGIFGRYLNSRGHKNDKILCTTCHGSPHAEYPSTLAKDNQQVMNLQGLAKPIGVCNTCHTGKSANYGVPAH